MKRESLMKYILLYICIGVISGGAIAIIGLIIGVLIG